MLSEDEPNRRPFETDTTHVVIRNLDQLLQAEDAWLLRQTRRLDLLPRDVTQRLNKVDDGSLRVEPGSACDLDSERGKDARQRVAG